MEISPDLQRAIENELRGIPTKRLIQVVETLSRRYREGHGHAERSYLHGNDDALAYIAYRLPATFAAIYATLSEIRSRLPDWQPRTLLDAGAGPGTALWAAAAVWPGLQHATLVERDAAMMNLGTRMARQARAAVVRNAEWRHGDVLGLWKGGSYDLIIGSYILGELPPSSYHDFASRLWSRTEHVLLIIEPGTPRGFELIRAVRDQLIAGGAMVVAPCPHQQLCPMTGNDWCHFAQRVARSRLLRSVKQASLPYEDEKFSYVAFSRQPGLPIAARVIRHPQIRPGQISLELCTPGGIERRTVTRRSRDRFRRARDTRWGAVFEDVNPE